VFRATRQFAIALVMNVFLVEGMLQCVAGVLQDVAGVEGCVAGDSPLHAL